MEAAVLSFISKHKLLKPKQTVLVAVSGGPDSMALLHLLWSNRTALNIVVCACHVHHQLRGKEADDDEVYIQQFCKEKSIRLFEKKVDVKSYATYHQVSTQVAARQLRYQWFSELANEMENSVVATGHHGDDQMETMMMKIVGGSYALKPYGILPKRTIEKIKVIRPFLGITKDEIEHYCNEACIEPRRDSSNKSRAYTRNRFREDLLPHMKRENQKVHIHMQRQSEWAYEDDEFLMQLAEDKLSSIIVQKNEQIVTISRSSFVVENMPLQRRMIHLILNYLYGKYSPTVTSIHIEQVIHMIQREQPGGEHYLPHSFLFQRDYNNCHFMKEPMNKQLNQSYILSVPGYVQIADWSLHARITNMHNQESVDEMVVDYDEVTFPLSVRHRLPNDRMHCRGMNGTKKIGRLFIDRKIPKQERDKWPIVIDGAGRILWVPLLHRSMVANVHSKTKKRLILSCNYEN
ncbi:tRNA lysidine(34) synthetase TilS [Halalkalibacter sp. APA_J-10(15)]|uniref:tRNA lysidine(34) synthetase TilS n=1 Tax=Halalkalibacter sp. APA_J-10(15) TaxID=2933805 RepID=UPI001FF46B09|nr:tRNA lysidine(34) synthetase TilS [Halalkalibacter sp. APA_J-10(15)]MCK0473643.1 tRNA lysidine(34) synthetase TilS [Halalkalibacter sp. APA_J-10(15)]